MKQWFKDIFDKESTVSSKRIVGVIIIAWTLVSATVFLILKDKQTSDGKALIEFMVSAGSGLLGMGVFEKVKGKNKDKNEGNS